MKLKVPILLALLVCGQSFGQSVQKNPIKENGISKSYPIDGTPLLQKQYQQAAEYIASHPQEYQKDKLTKVSSWGFTVGSTHQWWAYSWSASGYYKDASTCRLVGTHCYIFVEDSMWSSRRVTQEAVDSIENDFDNMTPANPSRGIFEMDSSAFGAPPDVDNDPKIIILVLNIQDGYTGTGGYVAGFFDPEQELPVSEFPNSNDAEIYYIDANPTDLTTAGGIQLAMSTAAHEFQHMINWHYNAANPEPTFVNEGCSKLAEVYCGYPTSDLDLYANETNHYLFDWRTNDNTLVLNDYARAQRFFLYIWDRFGIGIFKYIVQTSQTGGIPILTSALSSANTSLSFDNLFTDWLIANELDDTTVNRLYGYAYPNLPSSNGKTFYNPNVSGTDTVQNIGAEYLIFTGGSNLSITFTNTGSNSNLAIEAIEIGASSKRAISIPFGSQFSEPGYGTTYNTIAFIAINEDPNNSAAYSYKASGTASAAVTELKWDTTEPVGYYPWATSDTLCVAFDAYPQGVLDSVRIALRRAGSINGGVYQFTGVPTPSPLGKLLAPITATITDSTTLPYPVPYKNWTSINLTSKNIATDNPFAVAFVMGSNPYAPGVMITDYPGQNPYHSYTYQNSLEASPDPAGWYYMADSDTSVAIYLIRAYVSLVTGVRQAADLAPTEFSLSQNFPNPFNPTTTINYQLPLSSYVVLKVYDVLGREVMTLVNAHQDAGLHSAIFKPANLPSGVYFYQLNAGGFVETKKMLLEK
jgi:hypothetical protein